MRLFGGSSGIDPTRLERLLAVEKDAGVRAERNRWRMTRALASLPQAIIVRDEHGSEVFRNAVAGAFLAARHGDALIEQAVRELFDEVRSGQPERRRLELLGPPRRVLDMWATPLTGEGEALGAMVVVDDVSERRKLEEIRRDFVANVSHELKTPIGALALMAETIGSVNDVEVVGRLAERMNHEALRVGQIIDDLLALAQIESEDQASSERLDVVALVDAAVERMAVAAELHRITIDVEGVDRAHALIGDRRQLVSALTNLLENACKYSDDGSTVEVGSTTDGPWVEISVRDHGIGIPSRDLARVFERFYRVDRARSRETGGTGLGLAIVRHVVANHHGDVRVESQEGEGSTFTLRLPSDPAAIASAPVEPARHAEPA